jgi:hypothetical protein
MISFCHSRGRSLPRLLGVLVVLLAPAAASAETAVFRNDCRAAVTVQTVTVVGRIIKRDQYVLRMKESTPKIKLDMDKVLQITDPRTGRTLLRDVLRVSKKPAAYSIVADRVGRVRLIAIPVPGAGAAMMKKP